MLKCSMGVSNEVELGSLSAEPETFFAMANPKDSPRKGALHVSRPACDRCLRYFIVIACQL